MQGFHGILALLILVLHLVIAPVARADAGKFLNSPDYTTVVQNIASLVDGTANSGQSPETIAQKLGNLQLQKYILETAEDQARCTNQTGHTIGVYTRSKKAPVSQGNTLYFLADQETTDDDWDCDGIFLPAGANVALNPPNLQASELTESTALRVVDGTRLVATANPTTGAIELNVPPAQVLTAADQLWQIPNLSQTEIDATVPNAPGD